MKKLIRRTIMAVLLLLFIGSVGMIVFVLKQYRDDERLYDKASGGVYRISRGRRNGRGRDGAYYGGF